MSQETKSFDSSEEENMDLSIDDVDTGSQKKTNLKKKTTTNEEFSYPDKRPSKCGTRTNIASRNKRKEPPTTTCIRNNNTNLNGDAEHGEDDMTPSATERAADLTERNHDVKKEMPKNIEDKKKPATNIKQETCIQNHSNQNILDIKHRDKISPIQAMETAEILKRQNKMYM
jgi:hypothetical protein